VILTRRFGLWVAVGLVAVVPPAAGARTSLEIVVDASRTMRLPLADGRVRIDAVREVLTVYWCLLAEDDPDVNVGLRWYGSSLPSDHERACSDSALVVPVGGVDRDALVRATRALEALGGSPLGYALERAAADLEATAATERRIVLLTDGWDSCGSDLEVLLSRLQVVDGIEVHVVGLGLSATVHRDLTRLAPTTNTSTSADLITALGEVAGSLVPWEGPGATVSVRAHRDGEPAELLSANLRNVLDGTSHALVAAGDGLGAEIPPGLYNAVLEPAEGGRVRFAGLVAGRGAEVDAVFDLSGVPDLALELVGAEVKAGGVATVEVTGAPAAGATLVLAPAGSGDLTVLDRTSLSQGQSEAQVVTPTDGQALEARLVVDGPAGSIRVLERLGFETVEVPATVTHEREPQVASRLEVSWTGPDNPWDVLTIVPQDAPEGELGTRVSTSAGSPLELPVPERKGRYLVRYVDGWSGRTLAKRSLRVRAPEAQLVAPSQVLAGELFAVHWEGPGLIGDCIALAAAETADDDYLTLRQTADGSPLWMTAPESAGAYEVRYLSGQRALARSALTVQGLPVVLVVPETAVAGMRFEVSWSGPSGSGDFVTIVRPDVREGGFLDWAYTSVGHRVSLAAPVRPGIYEVRYVRGADRATLATATIEVKELP
jgi:hypothetical protein